MGHLFILKKYIVKQRHQLVPPQKVRSATVLLPKYFYYTFLKKYPAIFSLWSGVHLVYMAKTRDTNSHVENWFSLIKNKIFLDNKYSITDFIEKLYSGLSDRKKERLVYLNKAITISKIKFPRKLDNIRSNFVQRWSKKRCFEKSI